MNTDSEYWWGFSDEHGWIVLDRADPRNVPGSSSVHFYRSSDGWEIALPRNEWDSPKIRGARNYLGSIANNELRSMAERQLARCREEYQRIQQGRLVRIQRDLDEQEQTVLKERNRVVRDKHKRHLVNLGLSGHATTRLSGWIRHTHCWNCKTPISSDVNLGCTVCSGIICHSCGACLCGYEAN